MPAWVAERHAALAPKFAQWAATRTTTGRAQALAISDVSGTEWPMFTAVLFLRTTSLLQAEWHSQDNAHSLPAPAVEFRNAIDAATDLIADPGNAAWAQKHWGERYLEEKNLFYRMLLISGLDHYESLTGDTGRYGTLLRQQVASLAAELDTSEYGVLEHYPGEVYPVDVLMAYAALHRAHRRLGVDDRVMQARALRAFTGLREDSQRQLPAYLVDIDSGEAMMVARGVGISVMLLEAPAVWPQQSQIWYAR